MALARPCTVLVLLRLVGVVRPGFTLGGNTCGSHVYRAYPPDLQLRSARLAGNRQFRPHVAEDEARKEFCEIAVDACGGGLVASEHERARKNDRLCIS